MKSYLFGLCVSALLFFGLIGCRTIAFPEKKSTIPTSVEFPRDKKSITDVNEPAESFISLLNRSHPGNRIGYRCLEYKPIVYGDIPQKLQASMETVTADALQKQYAGRPGVFVYPVDITNKQDWTPQTWTYYIVPAADGFDLLWVIATKEKGLNEYYSVQQCFRATGKTNRKWRRAIAEAPAFSEYDLWAKQESDNLPKTSLSFVRRNNAWEAIAVSQQQVVCRTPLGLAMDTARSGGDLTKIADMKPSFSPRQDSSFAPDIDCGLVTRSNLKDTWVCALYWENTTHISDHHPADCLHTFVNIGPLPPNSKRAVRGKIYWMKVSKDQLFERWQKTWAN